MSVGTKSLLYAGAYTIMIGGHARSENWSLVTNNPRGFEHMEGLRLPNWV